MCHDCKEKTVGRHCWFDIDVVLYFVYSLYISRYHIGTAMLFPFIVSKYPLFSLTHQPLLTHIIFIHHTVLNEILYQRNTTTINTY